MCVNAFDLYTLFNMVGGNTFHVNDYANLGNI